MATHDIGRSGIHVELPNLLLQRHATQKVIDALFGRHGGLAVKERAPREGGGRAQGDGKDPKKKAGCYQPSLPGGTAFTTIGALPGLG